MHNALSICDILSSGGIRGGGALGQSPCPGHWQDIQRAWLWASIFNVLKSSLHVTKWFTISLFCFPTEEKRESALFPGRRLLFKNVRGVALLATILTAPQQLSCILTSPGDWKAEISDCLVLRDYPQCILAETNYTYKIQVC